MHHSFDTSIAKEHGINVAIFLNNIAFWIQKNQANNSNFHEGRYWTYNSSKAWSILFPYWSTDQIDRIIKKCVSVGLLMTGNFNTSTYFRERWYSLTDDGLKLFNLPIPQNRGMDSAKSPLPFRGIAEYITDIKPDIKPDKRERTKRAPLSLLPDDFLPSDELKDIFIETATRCEINKVELFEKFMSICKSNGKLSADWNAELKLFLLREKPSSNKSKEKSNTESRSTVKEWGPGHPSWESMNGTSSH